MDVEAPKTENQSQISSDESQVTIVQNVTGQENIAMELDRPINDPHYDFGNWNSEERRRCIDHMRGLAGTSRSWNSLLGEFVFDVVFRYISESIPLLVASHVLSDLAGIFTFNYQDQEQVKHAMINANQYFMSIIDTLAAVERTVNEKQFKLLGKLVSDINTKGWMPMAALVEHLSFELIAEASVIKLDNCRRTEGMLKARHKYMVEQYSLGMECIEGFSSLYTLLADVALSNLPEIVYTREYWYIRDGEEQYLQENAIEIEKFEQKVKLTLERIHEIFVAHKISLVRVADLVIRSFATHVERHWPFFLKLLQIAEFPELGNVLGFLISQKKFEQGCGKKTYGTLSEQLSYYRDDMICDKPNLNFTKMEKLLSAYTNDILGFTSIVNNQGEVDKTREKSIQRDWSSLIAFVEDSRSNVSTKNIVLVAAMLIKHGLAKLETILDHLNDKIEGIGRNMDLLFASQDHAFKEVFEVYMTEAERQAASEAHIEMTEPEMECAHASLLFSVAAVGDLKTMYQIFEYYAIDWIGSFPKITIMILRLLQWILTPTKEGKIVRHSIPKDIPGSCSVLFITSNKKEFYAPWTSQLVNGDEEQVSKILGIVKEFIYLSPACVYLLALNLKQQSQMNLKTNSIWENSTKMLSGYLLPSLMLIQTPSNTLTEAVWSIFREWSVNVRYALYAKMESVYANAKCEYESGVYNIVGRMASRITKISRYYMKRISKDVIKAFARKLTRLSNGNPLGLYVGVVENVNMYENLIGPVLEVFKGTSDMSSDVLIYIVLKALDQQLEHGKALKCDGQNLETWMTNSSQFLTKLMYQQRSIEVLPVLAFIDHDNFGMPEAQVLSDMITNMTGIPPIQDVPEEIAIALESSNAITRRKLIAREEDYKGSCDRMTSSIRIGERHLRFLQRLKYMYTQSGMKNDWTDMETIEKTTQSGLLTEMQWRDRIKSYLDQYILYLRLYCDYQDCEAPMEPKSDREALFDTLKYHHLNLIDDTSHKQEWKDAQTRLLEAKGCVDAGRIVQRAIKSKCDLMYVLSWIDHEAQQDIRQEIAQQIVVRVWAVAGMTEVEAGFYACLLAKMNSIFKDEKPILDIIFNVLQAKQLDIALVRNILYIMKELASFIPIEQVQNHLLRLKQEASLRVMVTVVEGELRASKKRK